MANRNITNILSVGSGLTRGRPTTDGMAGSRFRLNGLGGSAMGITANGSDANGAAGSPNISGYGGYNKIDVMSSEAVGEVQVVKGVMPAEYSGAMGGSMSVITKSGTNEWHGSLFHRYEGSVLSARQATLDAEPNSARCVPRIIRSTAILSASDPGSALLTRSTTRATSLREAASV